MNNLTTNYQVLATFGESETQTIFTTEDYTEAFNKYQQQIDEFRQTHKTAKELDYKPTDEETRRAIQVELIEIEGDDVHSLYLSEFFYNNVRAGRKSL